MVCDVVPERLELARELGAEMTVLARDDVDAAVRDWTYGDGADVAMEAAGRRADREHVAGAASDGSARQDRGLWAPSPTRRSRLPSAT